MRVFAPSVPKVMIWATHSSPYFSRHSEWTSWRRVGQKSISKSGGETRSGSRKRSEDKAVSKRVDGYF